MSEESVEQVRGRRQTVSLARLYLDPNNFRFVDNPAYQPVAAEDVFSRDVQRLTSTFLLGRSQEHVQDLIASIKENGWLDIDPILVERQEGGRFLIVEGNRRVATLKHLQREYDGGAAHLGKLDVALFSRVPVVLHDTADERQHMVMMGLHHISGKRRWPAINRALAMQRLQEQFNGDADAARRALGVRKQDFNRSVRTLALVDAYKSSDYGDQFKSDQYTLFREALGRPAIRSWLGWSDSASVARDAGNLDRLFNWMSQVDDTDDGDVDNTDVDTRQESSPVITTLGHVRELAKLIEDPIALKRLEETRSLQEATLSSDLLVKTEIERAFGDCDDGILKLNKRVGELDSEDLDRVEHLIGKLHGISYAHKRRPAASGGRMPWQPFNERTHSQFSTVRVNAYRGISGLALEGLERVNLIAGINNAGKTSLLEAIYLLAHQNDETALLDVTRWRGRMAGEPDPVWLTQQLQQVIHIDGHFDAFEENGASLDIQRIDEPDEDIKDQTSFLTKLRIKSCYGGRDQSANVALFSDRPHRASFQGQHWLCRSALTSPFGANGTDLLTEANEAALEAGVKAKVIGFIVEHIDKAITSIELVKEPNRFLVSQEGSDQASDLSSFGDGMRRIFEIGLLFASVRGGVLLIDEFENAIHTALLDPFTRIVQELAAEHDVQVFLTTHSKETLDAFIKNGYRTDDIAGYGICRGPDGAHARRFDGDKLLRLNRAVDFDLRGIR